MEQNYYAIFFNTEGQTVTTLSGMVNMEPLGMFEEQVSAIEQAQKLFPSNHIKAGVCMLKDAGKGLGGFEVVDFFELQDKWRQMGDAA